MITTEIKGQSMAKAKRARKNTPVTVAPIPWDQGASGAANQINLVTEDRAQIDLETGKASNPNGIKGRRRAPWVETYRKQGKLTPEQYAAALRLYACYQGNAERDPLAALGLPKGGGCNDPLAVLVDRRREFYAMAAKIPRSSRPAIEHAVLNDLPLMSMSGCSNQAAFQRHLDRLRAGLDAIC